MGWHSWTEREHEILREHYKTKSSVEIAEILGRTKGAISSKKCILGLRRYDGIRDDRGKICSRCGVSKPYLQYHRNPNTPDKFASTCKECCRDYQRDYRRKNKEQLRKNKKEYRERNREKVAACKRRYYIQNRERICARVIQWQKDNPEKVRVRERLRSFRCRASGGQVSEKQWKELKAMFGERCASLWQETKVRNGSYSSDFERGVWRYNEFATFVSFL